MQVFGTVIGVALCLALLAYIGVSIFKIIRDVRRKRNISDEFDNVDSDK